jgi:hypothetical protein
MLDEHVELFEGAFVEQQIDAFARGELALGVLGRDPSFAAAHAGVVAPLLELFKDMLHAKTPFPARIIRTAGKA